MRIRASNVGISLRVNVAVWESTENGVLRKLAKNLLWTKWGSEVLCASSKRATLLFYQVNDVLVRMRVQFLINVLNVLFGGVGRNIERA